MRAGKPVPNRRKRRILGGMPSASETVGDKLHRREGNSPDHQLRPPNDELSGKGCESAKTTRRFA